ncbi:MAG: WG repeat-containing protein [Bacteroidales bacterium]|nr:WG repeat-containing protein [Bacteroidales bacterium]
MNTSNHHHRTFFAGITLFLSFFAATAFGQPAALTPALVETVQGCTSIGGFHENISVVSKNGRYGYIRRDGRWAVRPKYEMAGHFNNGRGAVVRNGCLGYVDSNGNEVVACSYHVPMECVSRREFLMCFYEDYGMFHGGMAVVWKDAKVGAIDRNGTVRVPFGRYEYIFDFCEGLAFAREKGGKGVIIDTNGNVFHRFPDSIYLGNTYKNRERCFAAMADWYDTVTEKPYYGLIDIRGNWLKPPRLGRLRYINEEETILLHYYEYRESDAKRDTTIINYNYVYDLVRQRELAFDPKEMDSLMNGSKEICAYVDGKRFVKKEMDGKSRVVMMDTAGHILRTLPLGVYDCQPWSEGLSVVRLKDGQFPRYGLMDAEGNLTFRKEELAEAERLASAQLSLPSWPELKLDSQWIAEQSQLLEEAYQEKSEEKKQLFFRRCAEAAAAALPRTDNDTLREVEEVFKTFCRSQKWKTDYGRSALFPCKNCYLQSYMSLRFGERIDDLERDFQDYLNDTDYHVNVYWWTMPSSECFVLAWDSLGNFCPEMEECPKGYFALPVFLQMKRAFVKEDPYSYWGASEEYRNRTEFWGLYPADEYLSIETMVFDKGMKHALLIYYKYYDYHEGEWGYCLMKKNGRGWTLIRQLPMTEYLHRD